MSDLKVFFLALLGVMVLATVVFEVWAHFYWRDRKLAWDRMIEGLRHPATTDVNRRRPDPEAVAHNVGPVTPERK